MNNASINIDKLVYGGAGFALLNGKVCFVPFTAPGDQILMQICKEKRSYCEGKILAFERQSTKRVVPVCSVFGSCGGCTWQHIDYAEQCLQKEMIFADFLRRGAQVEPDKIQPILPALNPYNYRSRAQFKVQSVGGVTHLGFYRQSSHVVVEIPDNCRLVVQSINAAMNELKDLISSSSEVAKISQISLACGDDGTVAAVLHYRGNAHAKFKEWLLFHKSTLTSTAGLHIQ